MSEKGGGVGKKSETKQKTEDMNEGKRSQGGGGGGRGGTGSQRRLSLGEGVVWKSCRKHLSDFLCL